MTIDCIGCGSKSLESLAIIVRDTHLPHTPEHQVAEALLRAMAGKQVVEPPRGWRKRDTRNKIGICTVCALAHPDLVDSWERMGIRNDAHLVGVK